MNKFWLQLHNVNLVETCLIRNDRDSQCRRANGEEIIINVERGLSELNYLNESEQLIVAPFQIIDTFHSQVEQLNSYLLIYLKKNSIYFSYRLNGRPYESNLSDTCQLSFIHFPCTANEFDRTKSELQ